MKLGALLMDVLAGLGRRPATVDYPREQRATPATLRGALHWDPSGCTGCGLCVKDCPAAAIELTTVDKAAKRFEMHYAADRCIFCGQCVRSCRFDCLTLAPGDWELATTERASLKTQLGDKANVDAGVGHRTQPDPDPAH